MEIALVWELICKKGLPPRPLVCVGPFWQPLIEMMSSIRPASRNAIVCAAGPEELAEFFPAAGGAEGP